MIFRRKSGDKEKRSTTPRKIFIWAAILTAIAGIVRFAEPLEDIYRGGRNYVRQRPADQTIVVVGVDERTVDALGSMSYSRKHDSDVVEKLIQMGAKSVYSDRAYSDISDAEGDKAFADTLARHRGKVFLGAILYENPTNGKLEEVLPNERFRSVAQVRSLDGTATPFGLSGELFFADRHGGVVVPSISADIAGVNKPAATAYRPDWAIQFASIPSLSFIDVAQDKVSPEQVRGKTVLIGYATAKSKDLVHAIGQGWFPGVYIHAVGAQTLREGSPRTIGWLAPWMAAAFLSLLFMRARRRIHQRAVVASALALAIGVPFALDAAFVTADFIPAFLFFATVAYRLHAYRSLDQARLQNAGTLMPNLAALRAEPDAFVRPIVAMRIRNYSAVCASFADNIEDDLITELVRRLTLPGEQTTFYQAEDVLYWLGPALPRDELEGHLEGLARLIESQFVLRGRKLDIHVAFGVDNDQARSISTRIGRALLAADTAAAKHQLIAFGTQEADEDRAWELSLMSELDAAIDAGDIWVAYQPQFSLKSGAMTGVEALVRWQHPERGAISPEAFIAPAESHNRMLRLTLNILRQATIACRPIIDANPGFRLSVNLSASLLEHPQLADKIGAILFMTGFPASSLTLEVTESAPFSEHAAVTANLNELAGIGIELSIDDYGTGNATLEYLRTVPCQEIKIDRRFVSGLTTNASDRLLVESTIELAHGLGRRVIAEGIEDQATLERLRAAGCDIAQGYFLAKPMRIEALVKLVADHGNTRAA